MKRILIFAGCALFLAAAAFGSAFDDNQKGIDALNAGRYDEAVSLFASALKESGNDARIKSNLLAAYNEAAFAADTAGDYYKAHDLLQKASTLAPADPNVRKNFAVLCYNEGYRRHERKKGEDVVGPLRESLGYDATLPQTCVLLGQAYYDLDDYRQAKEQWEKALQLDPKLDAVRKKLDKLNLELGNDGRLKEQYRMHFKVRYEGEVGWDSSREVLDILEEAYRQAGQKLNYFPDEPLTVIIYTQAQFTAVSGMPDWFAGLYDGKIRIRQSDVQGDKTRLRQIIYHEYMHALVHCLAGNAVPVWLNEGIAQCYEEMPQRALPSFTEKDIVSRRLASGMPDLDQVDGYFTARASEADVAFAYAFSKTFVAYCIEKGWDYNIKNLLDALKGGADPNIAFMHVYFRDLRQMRDDWLRDLRYDNR